MSSSIAADPRGADCQKKSDQGQHRADGEEVDLASRMFPAPVLRHGQPVEAQNQHRVSGDERHERGEMDPLPHALAEGPVAEESEGEAEDDADGLDQTLAPVEVRRVGHQYPRIHAATIARTNPASVIAIPDVQMRTSVLGSSWCRYCGMVRRYML